MAPQLHPGSWMTVRPGKICPPKNGRTISPWSGWKCAKSALLSANSAMCMFTCASISPQNRTLPDGESLSAAMGGRQYEGSRPSAWNHTQTLPYHSVTW